MAEETEVTLDELITKKLTQLNTILNSLIDIMDTIGTTVDKVSKLKMFNRGETVAEDSERFKQFRKSIQAGKEWVNRYVAVDTVDKLQQAFDEWWLSDLIKFPNLIEDMVGSCIEIGKPMVSATEGFFSEGTNVRLPQSWRETKNLLGQSNSYDIF